MRLKEVVNLYGFPLKYRVQTSGAGNLYEVTGLAEDHQVFDVIKYIPGQEPQSIRWPKTSLLTTEVILD